MNPYVLFAAVLVLIASHTATFYTGKQLAEGEAAKFQHAGLITYANAIKEALDENATNQTALTKLQSELARMQHPNLPVCSGSNSTNGASRLLYETQNAAFKELQRGDDEDFARCDRLNIDAIRLNTSISTSPTNSTKVH